MRKSIFKFIKIFSIIFAVLLMCLVLYFVFLYNQQNICDYMLKRCLYKNEDVLQNICNTVEKDNLYFSSYLRDDGEMEYMYSSLDKIKESEIQDDIEYVLYKLKFNYLDVDYKKGVVFGKYDLNNVLISLYYSFENREDHFFDCNTEFNRIKGNWYLAWTYPDYTR